MADVIFSIPPEGVRSVPRGIVGNSTGSVVDAAEMVDTLAKLNGAIAETLVVTGDSRLSDARTPTSHTHAASELSDSTAAGRSMITAADAAAQRTLLNVEDGATADQSDAEIETAYNNQVDVVSQLEAEAGTSTTPRRWTAARVKQAIDALASATGLTAADIDTLAELNAILTDATLIDTTDARLSDARTPTAHNHPATGISDSTAAGRSMLTAADAAAQRTLLNVEDGATADQSDAEIVTAYGNEVDVVSQAEAEAGTVTDVRRWTPQRVKQAIDALGGGGALQAADIDTLAELNAILTDATLIDTTDARLSDARTPTAHNHPATGISDSTAAGRSMLTAADAAAQRTLLNVENGATADQTNAEIAAAYDAEIPVVSQVDAEAGTSTTAGRWTPARVKQAIDALSPAAGGLSAADIDTLAELNAILTDATLIDTTDARLSDARTPTAHNHPATGISDSTAAGRSMLTAADAAAQRTLLNVENGATADQSDAEIETAYNNQVAAVTQGEAEAGTSGAIKRWTPARVKQAIDALALQRAETTTAGRAIVAAADAAAQRVLLNVEDGATADQSDAEIETAYNNQVGIVSQAAAEAGTSTTAERWTPERVKQAIDALGVSVSGIDSLAKLNALVLDATLSDSTAAGRALMTAADAAAQRTLLNVQDGATADQTDAEIETAYNNQVGIVSQAAAEAGTSTTAERWTPQRVKQAVDALALQSADINTLAKLNAIVADATLSDSTAAGRALMTAADASAQRLLLNVSNGATPDQTDAEIETAYNNQVDEVSQAEAEAGTSTTVRRWTALRVAQAIDALAPGGSGTLTAADIDTLAELNAILTDATLIDTADARLSDARTPTAHTHTASEVSDSTTAGRSMLTAADAAAQRTLLNVQDGATADQSDVEIEAAYNNQVDVVSQAIAEAGSSTTVYRWTPERVKQAIDALSGGGGGGLVAADIDTLAELNAILTDATLGDTTAAGRSIMAAADAAAQRTLLNVEDGATADQSDAEIETAYNNQVGIVSQAAAEAGTSTTAERWTPQRVAQAIDALAVKPADIDTLAELNAILTDATLGDTTAAGRALMAAADAAAQRTLLNVQDGATADQSDAEIETAYNNQVGIVSQAEAEAGTATTVRRWTAERVSQAIVTQSTQFVETENYDHTSTYTYFGIDPASGWVINRYDSSGTKTQATESNNGGTTDLATAWTNRLTLNYG